MFKAGWSSHLKSFISNALRFSPFFAFKYALDFLGTATYITVRYPVTGTRVRVRTDNFWKKLESGAWETDVMSCLAAAAGRGQTVIDAGAWIGPHTLLLSKMVMPEGRVYAFEPDPAALKLLKDNINATRCGNVYIEGLCLSSSPGSAVLRTCRATQGFGHSDSTIIQQPGKKVTGEITIPATTIDHYCALNGIAPDGIKIDVEGAEGLVIQGARRIISKCQPWVLVEFHGHLMDGRTRTECWQSIMAGAKQITFVDAEGGRGDCCDGAGFLPPDQRRHVFIRY